MKTLSADYSGDDYVNCYLRPLNLWLRTDVSDGSIRRQQRFHSAIVSQWERQALASQRHGTVPLFLEAVSVTDETEIGMDAIRLNGQEFRVEVAAVASGKPVVAYRRFEHHLMWCSDGITPLINAAYQSMLEAGQPVMQTGTDPAQSRRRGIGRQRLTSA